MHRLRIHGAGVDGSAQQGDCDRRHIDAAGRPHGSLHAPRADPAARPIPTVSAMIQTRSIDDIAQRLAALVPPGLREAQADLTANFRSVLQAGLRNLDLVTREEFDVQRCVLLRTREKIEELEQQLAALERSLGATPAQRN